MYNAIIVDDERIVLEGLQKTFKWEEYGFRICGLAENGEEALNILKTTNCHLVVTDIRMPDMDGLELARIIKDRYPYTHVIVISAYSDFEYAQQAIRFGVSGYLLKPLKDTELGELLLRVKADLELIKLMELTKINSSLNLNKTVLNHISQEAILRRLLDGDLGEGFDVNRYLYGQEWSFLIESFRIALCNVEFIEPSTASLFRKLAINTGLSCLEEMNIPAIEHSGFIVIFLDEGRKEQRKKNQKLLNNYKQSFEIELEKLCLAKFSITIGVSNLYINNVNLKKGFNEALCSYKHKYFLGTDNIIFYEDLDFKDYSVLSGEECTNIIDNIINIIFVGEENQLLEEVQNLFLHIEKQGDFTVKDINTKIIEVYFNISNAIKIINTSDIFTADGDIINEIQTLTSFKHLKKWFKDKIINLYKIARQYSYDDSSWMVQKAMYYVKANISKKITLDDISEHLHVNASYFSSTFKKNTGQNFIDYVTESKIQEAKHLLLSSTLKIKEISSKVGYNDYSYFCKVFKGIVNMTPLEFRMKGLIK
jgi:two-component system response regulator YesN